MNKENLFSKIYEFVMKSSGTFWKSFSFLPTSQKIGHMTAIITAGLTMRGKANCIFCKVFGTLKLLDNSIYFILTGSTLKISFLTKSIWKKTWSCITQVKCYPWQILGKLEQGKKLPGQKVTRAKCYLGKTELGK